MQRFFVDKETISEKQVLITDSRVHQIRDVLRMKIGDEIIVLDNTGIEYHAKLTNISQKEVAGEIIRKEKCQAEPKTQITLFQSLLAREKFQVVLQKCTEVGVCNFVPIITERSIVRKPEKIKKEKLSRFQSIITEAAEQSGRATVPSIQNVVFKSQALSELNEFDICLYGSILDCSSLKQILRDSKFSPEKIALFIGPEGGFSDSEIEEFSKRAVQPFSLGRRVLRTETAGIVSAAVILYELD